MFLFLVMSYNKTIIVKFIFVFFNLLKIMFVYINIYWCEHN